MSGNKGHKKTNSRANASHPQEEKAKPVKDQKKGKDKDGDAEMTIVVPSAKADEQPEKSADVAMNGVAEGTSEAEVIIDPKIKAANGKLVSCSR